MSQVSALAENARRSREMRATCRRWRGRRRTTAQGLGNLKNVFGTCQREQVTAVGVAKFEKRRQFAPRANK